MEAKKNELEKEEERILKDAASRRKSEGTPTGSDDYLPAPPPLPQAPPPLGAPPSSEDTHEPSGAAQRLDALISTNLKTNGHHHPQVWVMTIFECELTSLTKLQVVNLEMKFEKYTMDDDLMQNLTARWL